VVPAFHEHHPKVVQDLSGCLSLSGDANATRRLVHFYTLNSELKNTAYIILTETVWEVRQ
jgi:hypothetical protein